MAVVSIVSEMTGYPADLLDLDLDLEADLGVDTVKQAEVFAAVRERFGVERDESLSLREFPTLAHVIGWVRDKTAERSDLGAQPPSTTADAVPSQTVVHPTTVVGDLDAVDALPRRVPVPALRPNLDRCVPTGVTLEAGVRVVVMGDSGGVAEAVATRLAEAGVTVLALDPADPTDRLLALIDEWRSAGTIDGVYWLPALDDEGPLESLDLEGWQEGLRRRVKTLYATMRRLYDDDPFLIAATRLGGFHGYDDAGATAPMGGSVTGFAKAYKRERPDALVKAVDLAVDTEPATVGGAARRGDVARPRMRRGRPRRRAALGGGSRGAPLPAAGCGAGGSQLSRRGQRRGRHRCGRQHRRCDHRGSGPCLGGHLPSPRPHPGTESSRSRPASLRRGPGGVQGVPCRADEGARDEADPGGDREGAARFRAAGRRTGRDRRGPGSRRHRALSLRRPHRCRAVAGCSTASGSPPTASTSCCTPPAWR